MQLAHVLGTYIDRISRKFEMRRLLNSHRPILVVAEEDAPEPLFRLAVTPKTDPEYSSMSSQRPSPATAPSDASVDASNHDEERTILEILQVLRNLRMENPTTQTEVHSRLSTARNMISFLNTSSFMAWPERYNDQIFIVSELQRIAYHDTDHGGVQDIAQWCVRAYLQILSQNNEEAPEVLTGLGQAWLLRAQQTLARIHRLEGSSSSGASSGQRSAAGVGRAQSFTSSEDAREAARQNVEADARAGGPDYVEARGMLLPATEHLQRAIVAAERAQRVNGELLALAAEAYISLGNVSYSHHNEQYFQQAVRYLQQASAIPNYQLSPYLQSYLDDFGRLVS